MLYGRSGYLLGCLLLNRVHPGSVPTEAMQEVVEAIIESGGAGACRLPGQGHAPCCREGAGQPAGPPAAPSQPACPAGAGRGLAGRLRDRAAFPTPLFYMWPPGPDASPYLGAAHGLMGERAPAAAPPRLHRRPQQRCGLRR